MNRPQRIYVAGPMRGHAEFNFPAFDQAAKHLAQMGYEVFSPAERDRNKGFDPTGMSGLEDLAELGFDLADAMKADLRWITEHATGIAMLPGWEHSVGANHEKATAELLGLDVYYLDEEGCLLDWDPQPLADLPEFDSEPPELCSDVPLGGTGEVQVTNELTGGTKGSKPERYDLIPVKPLRELARVYGKGAEKYAPRNWELGYDWSLSYAALQRHVNAFWGGETHDPETGLHHLGHAMFHCMALIEWGQTHPDLDDRPSTKTYQEMVAQELETQQKLAEDLLAPFKSFGYDKVVVDPLCPPDQVFVMNPSMVEHINLERPDWLNESHPVL